MTGLDPARQAVEHLRMHLKRVQVDLDPNEHVQIINASGVPFIVFEIKAVTASDLITLFGLDDQGREVSAVQHLSQLNLAFAIIPRRDTSEPARPISFLINEEPL